MLKALWRLVLPRPVTKEQADILLILYLLCCTVIVAWQYELTYALLYPFCLISTIFHEFGHAFMVLYSSSNMYILCNAIDKGHWWHSRRHPNQSK